jgi:hypothetical protein
MAENINKKDALHDRMPQVFNTRNNLNWKAIVETIGAGDDESAELIEAVRQQFFVKTANRPYLDRLGSNNNVNRPRFVGMDDPTFRKYIPVLAYQPKQVKLILDLLLDIFFFKDSSTTFIETGLAEPFDLEDGWELNLKIDDDDDKQELITFLNQDFTDINAASADEVVSAINRQSKNFYAVKFEDSVRKRIFVRLFTRTIGAKGSISIEGGRANSGLQFINSFNVEAGVAANTIWEFTKVGDEVSQKFVGGNNPQIDTVQKDDIIILDLPGNSGSYRITEVDLGTQTIKYRNLFATEGTFQQTATTDVKFLFDYKAAVYKQRRRAVVWEISPGEIIVELPTSPPVVKRNRRGAAHINGKEAVMLNKNSNTELEADDLNEWPEDGGYFLLEPEQQIKSRHLTSLEDSIVDYNFKGRLMSKEGLYKYESRVGNVLSGISPDLPEVAQVLSADIDTIVRTSNIMTVTTLTDHKYTVGMDVVIQDSVPTLGMTEYTPNGSFKVIEIVDSTNFRVESVGDDGQSAGGVTRAERVGLSNSGSKLILHTSVLEPTRLGPYIWDPNSPFVLSSLTTRLTAPINSGDTARGIEVEPNEILDQEGFLIFDYGTEEQEGPVRYFFKASEDIIAIDPSYVFQKNHDIGSGVTMIRRRGAHILDGSGKDYPPYITDTSAAREVLIELMKQVKSVGIFINFLVRYPEQYYATLDVYESGIDPDDNWTSS